MSIHEVFPHLRVRNAPAAIAFYQEAFGAEEKYRLTEPGGRVGHCELAFGEHTVMIAEASAESGIVGPERAGGPTFSLHLHVDNADALIARAVKAGATLLREPKDQFYGERSGSVRDPFGHEWLIGHEIERVEPIEMQRRYDALMKGK